MKVLALLSGGKDSCFSVHKCQQHGHDVVALANLYPEASEGTDELDSMCFQTVGHEAIEAVATCLGLPLFRRAFRGVAKNAGMRYDAASPGDEVEDLAAVIEEACRAVPEIDAVASGAILSNYQRHRVEHVCERLGLTSLAFLWQRPQGELLDEMIACGMKCAVVKVASLGLSPERHLGRTIGELRDHFHQLHESHGMNVCGEGGEYETLTLDCPAFVEGRRIELVETSVIKGGHSVAHLRIHKLRVVNAGSKGRRWSTRSGIVCAASASAAPGGTRVGASEQDYRRAARMAMDSLCERVDPRDVFFVHLSIADMAMFGVVNKVYCEYFGSVNPPSRSCVQASDGRTIFSVDCMAAARDNSAIQRETLHVKSISEWAPVCIGPYSQGNTIGGVVFAAGQIGLDPASMALVPRADEDAQALRNCHAVLSCMKSSLADAGLIIKYVSTSGDGDALGHEAAVSTSQEGCAAMCVVPLAMLPRNAAVEYEIVALETALTGALTSMRVQHDRNGLSVFGISGSLCLAACYAECKRGGSAASVGDALQEGLLEALRVTGMSLACVQTLRLFHSLTSFAPSDLGLGEEAEQRVIVSKMQPGVDGSASAILIITAVDVPRLQTEAWLRRDG